MDWIIQLAFGRNYTKAVQQVSIAGYYSIWRRGNGRRAVMLNSADSYSLSRSSRAVVNATDP